MAFRKQSNGSLIRDDNELPFGWKQRIAAKESKILPQDENLYGYYGSAFVPLVRAIISSFETLPGPDSNQPEYHTMLRELGDDGVWKEWVPLNTKIGYQDFFIKNDSLFGVPIALQGEPFVVEFIDVKNAHRIDKVILSLVRNRTFIRFIKFFCLGISKKFL
jgi:hypothetical protein